MNDQVKTAVEHAGIRLDYTEKHSQVNLTIAQLEEICKEYVRQVAQKPVLYASLDGSGSVMYSEHTLSPLVARKPRINGMDKPLYHLEIAK